MFPMPMSYTVLARKYRPQTFADLCGQEHVTRTLTNAITSGRVAHAFLFTGVRGVGKTTSARLLAKALNCVSGPTPTPCNTCDPCREITAGHDLDVLEIDGASNNSVDDVRRLQESIPYRPARDRFKVVIVDEVHMLTVSAFNAFLKTLEEPPPHVKFIFATTEAHKVPITIRSRCQRYDFRLIPQAVVAARVRAILEAEHITADDATVAIVAREAAGSMRDALTLLDQVIAFGGDVLRGEEVARSLGLADRRLVRETCKALLQGDPATVLRAIDEIASSGTDLAHFARELLGLLRDLVVLRVENDATGESLVDMVPEERAEAEALARTADLLEIQRTFGAVARLLDEVARASTPRQVLEVGLVRVATRPRLVALSELFARLDALEQGSSPWSGRTGGGVRGPGGRPAHDSSAGEGSDGRASRRGRMGAARPTEDGSAHLGREDVPTAPPATPGRGPTTSGATDSRAPDGVPSRAFPVAPKRTAATTAASSARHANTDSGSAPSATPSAMDTTRGTGAPALADASASSSASAQGAMPAAASLDARPMPPPAASPTPAWERIVAYLRDARPALAAVVRHAVATEVSTSALVLDFPPGSFFGKQAQAPEAREGLAEAATAVLGATPAITVRFSDQAPLTGTTIAQTEAARENERREATRRRALAHPRVQDALEVFGASAERLDVTVDVDAAARA
jgi:DNA polymerase-3 subunit gamma/tau